MGNGVSELILMSMEALLELGDEVLVPAPDYPLWTAAVSLTGATPVHYPCRAGARLRARPRRGRGADHPAHPRPGAHQPQQPHRRGLPARSRGGAGARRRAPPAGALLGRDLRPHPLRRRARTSPSRRSARAPCARTFGGLSKVYRACGLRTGWLYFSGRKQHAADYLRGAGAARLAPPVRQRPRAVGGADRARRRAEHPRSHRRDRAPRPAAPRGRCAGSSGPRFLEAGAAAGRALRVPRRRPRRASRASTTRASPWSCWSASTSWWCRGRASTCRTPTTCG